MFKVIKVIDNKTLVINAGFKKNIIDNYEEAKKEYMLKVLEKIEKDKKNVAKNNKQ